MNPVHGRRGAGLVLLMGILLLVAGCKGSAPVAKADITIRSTPEDGADVEIGGVAYGATPLTVSTLDEGDVLIIATKDGYKRATQMVHVPATGPFDVTIELQPLAGYVTIKSNPAGAQVYLDGDQLLGETPAPGQ